MCKLLLKVINFTCAILSIIYLLHVYYDTYLDTSLFTFNPGEKENFFIDPQQNQNQYMIKDKDMKNKKKSLSSSREFQEKYDLFMKREEYLTKQKEKEIEKDIINKNEKRRFR